MLRRAMIWDNTTNSTPRPRRNHEVYEVQCSNCNRIVELPASAPFYCPRCSARLELVWRDDEQSLSAIPRPAAFGLNMCRPSAARVSSESKALCISPCKCPAYIARHVARCARSDQRNDARPKVQANVPACGYRRPSVVATSPSESLIPAPGAL